MQPAAPIQPQLGCVRPQGARPHHSGCPVLSNTNHKLLAKAIDATLGRVAELVVHPARRGFLPGRSMIANVLEALMPMHISALLKGSVPAVVLFDIRSALPGVSLDWIRRVLWK